MQIKLYMDLFWNGNFLDVNKKMIEEHHNIRPQKQRQNRKVYILPI